MAGWQYVRLQLTPIVFALFPCLKVGGIKQPWLHMLSCNNNCMQVVSWLFLLIGFHVSRLPLNAL